MIFIITNNNYYSQVQILFITTITGANFPVKLIRVCRSIMKIKSITTGTTK